MNKLNNKVAVITGGNSGIGLATAREFIAQGANVTITGRNAKALEDAVTELGGNAKGIVADAGNVAATEALVNTVKEHSGGVDTLFINAGVAYFSPIEGATEAHFDEMMNINFKGAYFTLNKFLPILNEGASVIFLSSVNATTGMAGSSVYSASKAALNSLMRVASTELSTRKIRVNAVSPGPIDTPIFSKTGMDQQSLQGFAEAISNRVPLKRFGKPEEVAKLVTFLASDEAGYITGSEYVIGGGIDVNAIMG